MIRRNQIVRFGFSTSNESSEKPKEEVNFGFKRVKMEEKQGMVNSVFDSVANKCVFFPNKKKLLLLFFSLDMI